MAAAAFTTLVHSPRIEVVRARRTHRVEGFQAWRDLRGAIRDFGHLDHPQRRHGDMACGEVLRSEAGCNRYLGRVYPRALEAAIRHKLGDERTKPATAFEITARLQFLEGCSSWRKGMTAAMIAGDRSSMDGGQRQLFWKALSQACDCGWIYQVANHGDRWSSVYATTANGRLRVADGVTSRVKLWLLNVTVALDQIMVWVREEDSEEDETWRCSMRQLRRPGVRCDVSLECGKKQGGPELPAGRKPQCRRHGTVAV